MWGTRPGPVEDPLQRRTVEHSVDLAPEVQLLDAPVPQMGNQLLEAAGRRGPRSGSSGTPWSSWPTLLP